MSFHQAIIAALFAAPFLMFAGVLGFASWDESRRTRK